MSEGRRRAISEQVDQVGEYSVVRVKVVRARTTAVAVWLGGVG